MGLRSRESRRCRSSLVGACGAGGAPALEAKARLCGGEGLLQAHLGGQPVPPSLGGMSREGLLKMDLELQTWGTVIVI